MDYITNTIQVLLYICTSYKTNIIKASINMPNIHDYLLYKHTNLDIYEGILSHAFTYDIK